MGDSYNHIIKWCFTIVFLQNFSTEFLSRTTHSKFVNNTTYIVRNYLKLKVYLLIPE